LHVAGIFNFLGPEALNSFGPWALVVVCLIVFAETGLLVGFILPGDTLLVITGLLTFTGTMTDTGRGIHLPIYVVCLLIGFAAFLGGEVGYLIGHKLGPRVFERKESGFFSKANVARTNQFFERFGGLAVIVARFVPVVRTFAPIAAGVGHMPYRKYSLYNLIGALVWGAGVTLVGYLLGYIPPVAHFVTEYIDFILLGAVFIGVVPTAFHYIRGALKARKLNAAGATDAGAADLTLDPSLFDQNKSNDR
jgi:membrane-associated protein